MVVTPVRFVVVFVVTHDLYYRSQPSTLLRRIAGVGEHRFGWRRIDTQDVLVDVEASDLFSKLTFSFLKR